MKDVTFSLRAYNVPRDLQHRRRADEIQQILDYIRVTAEVSSNLALVHMGTDAPPINQQDLLWVRSNPDGTPNGLYVFSEGDWVRANPHIVESEVSNLKIIQGTGTYTHSESADTTNTAQIATFDPEFEVEPIVLVSFVGGTMFSDAATYYKWNYRTLPDKDKWELEVRCNVDCSTVNRTLELSWMAIGEIV